jgi:hypothetical protein
MNVGRILYQIVNGSYIFQSGSGTNQLKATNMANVILTMQGTATIFQVGTGTNSLKTIQQGATNFISQTSTGATGSNTLKTTNFFGNVSLTDTAIFSQNSTNTGQNNLCRTFVRTRYGQASAIPFSIVDDISATQLILTSNNGAGAYTGMVQGGDSSIVAIGAGGNREASALSITPYLPAGNTVGIRMSLTNLSSRYASPSGSTTTILDSTGFTVNGDIIQSSTNIISQTGTQTNVFKESSFTSNVNISGNLAIAGYPDVGNTLTNITNSTTSLTGITYDNTGGIDKTTIDNNVYITKQLDLAGNIIATGTTNKISGTTTTIGSLAQTTTLATRDLNVVGGAGGIRLCRADPANAGFIELINCDVTGTTVNNTITIAGGTASDNRYRILFRNPTDFEVMAIRRTQSNFYTPLDVSGNFTQGNTFIISQSGISGTNTMRSITLNTDGKLTLQGTDGCVLYSDGTEGRTHTDNPISGCDIFSYGYFKPVFGNPNIVVASYDYSSVTSGTISVGLNNIAWVLVKLTKGVTYYGVVFYTTTATANINAGLYDIGPSAPQLARTRPAPSTPTSVIGYNYFYFQDSAANLTPYTSPETKYAYIGMLSTSASLGFYTYNNGNTNFGKTAVNNSLTLACCTSANTSLPTPFSGVVTARVDKYLMMLFTQ